MLLASVYSDAKYFALDTLKLDHVSCVVMHEGSNSCLFIKNLVDSIILRIYLIFMTVNIHTFDDDT